ncbi:nucleotidyl transferase AbiEii/AbiGii toxin family protein [Photorhabdus khanii]|uniref:Nucleotidyl transferase AbiEii/AbiGii toxin family protein n=1 Tax=Photorhabdus khanii subsp. guanajuatensis TaxID=2100166 RepID=A0A4R4JTZ1_9GAMM|nr:nucleotidyl transferase AbiEii/AbiGii toxin family protein [Photorhabdus khanii]TDB58144.1 nucleotidyl transferase AbiEii/AbiGii toxin family protein [Photorhabdus khanii subsp. guanajuatensis]
MSDKADFNIIVDEIVTQDGLANIRPVVEKELLHYDILYCLAKDGLLKTLTFQGGTSLRLCYGSNRFSEDLDFAGGRNFCSADLNRIKESVEKYLGERYGLEVTVKEPNELRKEPEYVDVKIDKWQVSVITAPERKDLPKQRIKIEIANIPAYTKNPRPLTRNYSVLPDGYSETIVSVEELTEIMADKLVSFPATTKHIRHRDMWDLVWLKQQGVAPDVSLIERKLSDYHLTEFADLLQARLDSIQALIVSGTFQEEMKRFIPVPVYSRTIGKADFMRYLENTLKELLITVQKGLYAKENNDAPFKM